MTRLQGWALKLRDKRGRYLPDSEPPSARSTRGEACSEFREPGGRSLPGSPPHNPLVEE